MQICVCSQGCDFEGCVCLCVVVWSRAIAGALRHSLQIAACQHGTRGCWGAPAPFPNRMYIVKSSKVPYHTQQHTHCFRVRSVLYRHCVPCRQLHDVSHMAHVQTLQGPAPFCLVSVSTSSHLYIFVHSEGSQRLTLHVLDKGGCLWGVSERDGVGVGLLFEWCCTATHRQDAVRIRCSSYPRTLRQIIATWPAGAIDEVASDFLKPEQTFDLNVWPTWCPADGTLSENTYPDHYENIEHPNHEGHLTVRVTEVLDYQAD